MGAVDTLRATCGSMIGVVGAMLGAVAALGAAVRLELPFAGLISRLRAAAVNLRDLYLSASLSPAS